MLLNKHNIQNDFGAGDRSPSQKTIGRDTDDENGPRYGANQDESVQLVCSVFRRVSRRS
jgi:hypothetical protein